MPIDINFLRTYKGGDPDTYCRHMKARYNYKNPSIVDQTLAIITIINTIY